MNKLTLLFVCFIISTTLLYSQNYNVSQNKKEKQMNYQVSIGVNAIDNSGDRSPIKGDWAFQTPFSIGIEARSNIKKNLALVGDFGYNDYDGLRYYSVDGGFKYYLNDWIRSEKFEIAPTVGGGVFNINRTNVSVNVGGSVAYWFSKSLALRIKSLAKFALNNNDPNYNISNKHFMHNLEVVFLL